MNRKSGTSKAAATRLVKSIRRKTRQTYPAEEKIRIVLAGLRGVETISVLCRRESISESLCYSWSKEFLEAGKRRLSGDTARQASVRCSGGSLAKLSKSDCEPCNSAFPIGPSEPAAEIVDWDIQQPGTRQITL